ncbi:hypothetical protein Q9S71_14765 [Microbacterium sp. KSW4-11]|uniref:Colicin import membrane protein n=1 Tax=Microbacterium gawkjiense TaxID=3067309 RepID=A0ABU3GE64_9MICO|nr:hypothetical protein [Microbacterium sp. KSW4-11]MDT3318088.1 hypothetical protein [Microbacterium sp. KSW4-11]
MVDDTDGVGETFDNSLRIALTVASQFGERFVRLREEWNRQREAAATQEARELQSRLDAERAAVRGQLAVVDQPSWWDRADVRDIADAREAAVAWRDHDVVAARANETIRREVQDRYGIDVDAAGVDPAAAADALRRAEADRAQAREEQRRSGEELTASQILLSSAEARDRNADAAAEHGHGTEDPTAAFESASHDREAAAERSQVVAFYDSAERRAEFARSLEGTASAEEVRGRVLADAGNARSPREAVAAKSASTPKARKIRAASQERSRGLAR